MMTKQIWKSACMLFMGCLTSLIQLSCDNPLPGEKENFVFQLRVPAALSVETKGGTLDQIGITDVRVLQYNKANGLLLHNESFSGAAIGNTGSNQTIEVKTGGFTNIDSYFYVIVNAGTDYLTNFSGTQDELKKQTKTITAGTHDEPTLLSSDRIEYTAIPVEGGNNDNVKAIIVAPLQRTFARIKLKWASSGSLTGTVAITGVTVGNLPKSMALHVRGGAALNTTYPLVSDISSTPVSTGALAQGSFRTFYIAENLRGIGSGITLAEKNMKDKAPKGSLDGCTYIILTGNYTYPGASAAIEVQYKIYPGGNLTNDYNIQRGYSYDLTATIGGANSADVRVSITSGNVAIFDEVQTIENTVDF